jgi:RimJ/RimL family protein N-acetyltransferase
MKRPIPGRDQRTATVALVALPSQPRAIGNVVAGVSRSGDRARGSAGRRHPGSYRTEAELPDGVFEIGVVLYQPTDRGHGYGPEAVELMTGWLFESAGAERVQAGTDAGNAAMRAVLERLGFRLEGILRAYGATSDGSRIDGALYAILRAEWIAEHGR